MTLAEGLADAEGDGEAAEGEQGADVEPLVGPSLLPSGEGRTQDPEGEQHLEGQDAEHLLGERKRTSATASECTVYMSRDLFIMSTGNKTIR